MRPEENHMKQLAEIGSDIEKKSSRHSHITGNFAEYLVLYWLSRGAFECARVDHTGIDLVARNPLNKELMGISVKSRSRYRGTERTSLNIPTEEFSKVAAACEAFGCEPYFAIVVDGGGWLRLYLTAMSHLLEIPKPGKNNVYWSMNKYQIERYRSDSRIKSVELNVSSLIWWRTPTQ
jgi:hypothetical protein